MSTWPDTGAAISWVVDVALGSARVARNRPTFVPGAGNTYGQQNIPAAAAYQATPRTGGSFA